MGQSLRVVVGVGGGIPKNKGVLDKSHSWVRLGGMIHYFKNKLKLLPCKRQLHHKDQKNHKTSYHHHHLDSSRFPSPNWDWKLSRSSFFKCSPLAPPPELPLHRHFPPPFPKLCDHYHFLYGAAVLNDNYRVERKLASVHRPTSKSHFKERLLSSTTSVCVTSFGWNFPCQPVERDSPTWSTFKKKFLSVFGRRAPHLICPWISPL